MTNEPATDDLKRGHVVLAPEPFVVADETTRPWVDVNNERMSFDTLQYIVMGMTTRTWYEERVALSPEDYRHRRALAASSIVPHAVASLVPALITDDVCRLRDEPIDRAVDVLVEYL